MLRIRHTTPDVSRESVCHEQTIRQLKLTICNTSLIENGKLHGNYISKQQTTKASMEFSAKLAKLQKMATDVQKVNSSDRNDNNNSNKSNNLPIGRPSRPPSKPRRYNNRSRDVPYSQDPLAKRQRREVEGPYRNPKWNVLKHAVESLPKFQPPTETKSTSHLCLLAITINELPMETIWREWASRQPVTISLICHAKEPHKVQSDWLQSRLLVEPPRLGRGHDFAPPIYRSHRPKWGSIEITRAMLDLCAESLRIGMGDNMPDPRFSTNRYAFHTVSTMPSPLTPVDKVLFISETCIPVADLTEEHLSSPCSIVNWMDRPNNGFSRQVQFERIHSLVPIRCKADQWMMLARPHLEWIMNELPRNFWECFQDCNASDELYFPTALALAGIGMEDQNSNATNEQPQLIKRRITFADWSISPKNPATFESKDLKRVVEEALKEGCLVARKFVGVGLEEWRTVVFQS